MATPNFQVFHGLPTLLRSNFTSLLQRELQTSSTSNRRPALRCGKVNPRLPVPDNIPKPPYVSSKLLPEISSEHQVHDPEGIARMKAACELAARVLEYAGSLVRGIKDLPG